jgi:hypothetical protein
MGVREGSTFATGSMKVTVKSCPTQQKWFGLFLQGAENRMGYVSQCNQPLCKGVIQKLLEAVKVEIQEVKKEWLKREYIKFGAATSLAIWISQRPRGFPTGPGRPVGLSRAWVRQYPTRRSIEARSQFLQLSLHHCLADWGIQGGFRHNTSPHCPGQSDKVWHRTEMVAQGIVESERSQGLQERTSVWTQGRLCGPDV